MTEATDGIARRAIDRQRAPSPARTNWLRVRYPLVSVLAVLALFGAWELATDLFRISPMTLPSPRLIAKSFQTMLSRAIPARRCGSTFSPACCAL